MLKKSIVAFGCVLAVMANSANAGLVYSEFTSGDSNAWFNGNGKALGNVGSGDYILGRVDNTGSDSFWEGYNFILDGSVSRINFIALTGPVSNDWQLSALNCCNQIGYVALNTAMTTKSINVSGLTGTYVLSNNGINPNMAYNYQISFDQASDAAKVPEPGSMALLGLALAGWCAARRRKA